MAKEVPTKDVLDVVQEEDYVEYFVFPEGLAAVDPPDVKQTLDDIASLISCTVSGYLQEYFWHKDPFNISTGESSRHNRSGLPPHLYGISHFGDNIEDEWFIVFLLMQLTKDINGLVVRVVDSDGEFLLIEAADYLPSKANPLTCKERVFVYNGEVHMIPLPSEDHITEGSSSTSILDAVEMIRQSPDVTCANQHIQNAVRARITGYPDRIKANLHRTTVYVPVGVAAVLKENPNLISPAVRAFCQRDPIDMRACRAMKYFPPENCVMTSVLFTRCLYAMISHQKFTPDRRTGWTLPPVSSKDYKPHSLGVKLACGFEILVSQAKPGDSVGNQVEQEPNNLENILASRGWLMYVESLKKKGYFKDLLEGSKDYTLLLQKAQEFYVHNCASVSRGVSEVSGGYEVLALLNKLEIDADELKKASQNLPLPDDESWLEISPEELDKMLAERYGPLGGNIFKTDTADPHDITTSLNTFLEHVSDLDGAEFPSSSSKSPITSTKLRDLGNKIFCRKSVKGADGQGASDEMSNSMMDSSFNFDPDSFCSAVQNILDFAVPEDSWDLESDSDGSDMGSYEDESEVDLQVPNSAGKGKSPQTELKQYMDQMDRELASTTLADSFVKKSYKEKSNKEGKQGTSNEEDAFEDVEDFQPVDIDMNALKNILESYQSQLGGAGPASNLLGPMGVNLETLSSNSMDSSKSVHPKD